MIFITALIIFHFASHVYCHDYNEEGWKNASAFIRAAMDPTKEPCRDFYGYACGRWINRESREGSDELRDAETKLRDLLLRSLENINLTRNGSIANYQKWLRIFYDQCMNLSVMTESELLVQEYRAMRGFFIQLLKKANGTKLESWPTNIWLMAGLLEQNFFGHFLIEATVDWVFINCTKKSVLKLAPPSRPYLKMTLEQLTRNLVNLHEAMEINFTSDTIETQAQLVKDFENSFVDLIDMWSDKASSAEKNGKLIKLSNLSEHYPDIDWDAYFAGLFPEDWADRWNESDPQVLIVGDYYFQTVPSTIKRHAIDAVQNYAYWKLITQIKEFYVSKTSEGVSAATSIKAKQDFCYGILKEFAPAAVARMYFDTLKTDVVEWRNDVDVLAQNLLSAFRIFVSGQDWLDAQDKMAIINRINNIRIDTGIPIWLANDTEVNSRTPVMDDSLSPLQNVISANRIEFMRDFRPLVTPGAAFKEPSPEFKAGARYVYGKIEVNLGQLLPPLYHHHYPLAVKYGMLGWLLGHELLHGFDEASLRESPVNGKNWLRKDIERMFHQKKRCMVKQYSAYCYKTSGGRCLSGVKTVNENIGDIEGLKVAFMAYKFVTQTIGQEPPLPELVKLSNDQVFFISAAQLHCGKEYDFIIASEEHPPSKVRVEQSMRNFPVFAQAFQCKKGSKFSPIRTCSLWGQFLSPNQCDDEDESKDWWHNGKRYK